MASPMVSAIGLEKRTERNESATAAMMKACTAPGSGDRARNGEVK